MYSFASDSIVLLREQMRLIKADSQSDKTTILTEFKNISDTWSQLSEQSHIRESETINRLTVDHELELNDIKKYLMRKNEEIESLKGEKIEWSLMDATHKEEVASLTATIEELQNRIALLEIQTNAAESEKLKAIADLKENLLRDHKTEIESLRCRFKLMTNTERSPSETSLEKIDRLEVMDLSKKERIDPLKVSFSGSSPRSPSSGHDMFKRILDDKERQLDTMRQRDVNQSEEIVRLKTIIQSMTEMDSKTTPLPVVKEELVHTKEDRDRQKNDDQRSRRPTMESSGIGDQRYNLFLFSITL